MTFVTFVNLSKLFAKIVLCPCLAKDSHLTMTRGSTMAGVKEGVGTPAACSNNREGKGVPLPRAQGAKFSLMAGLPRS